MYPCSIGLKMKKNYENKKSRGRWVLSTRRKNVQTKELYHL